MSPSLNETALTEAEPAQTEPFSGAPIFEVQSSAVVAATPQTLYDLVSDLPASGRWSPECRGGEWIGEPAKVGSVFRGSNERGAGVVAWAPVVRGGWQTEAEIIASEPGVAFSWSMRDKAGRKQDSIWSWFVEPHPEGAKLTHHFRMGEPTEGIKGIVSGMTAEEKDQFFHDWGLKLQGDLNATVETVKRIAEAGA